jgi:hypothetical protein
MTASLFEQEVDRSIVTAGGEGAGEGPPMVDTVVWEEATSYPVPEVRGVLLPALVLLSIVILLLVADHLTDDGGSRLYPLEDVDTSGSFHLAGDYSTEPVAYGPSTHAINLTLNVGDRLVLTYSSFGPSGGIQVRLQHPLSSRDGVNGTGGTEVHSMAAGGNGTMDFLVREGGAYQVYFWHPGSARPPHPGEGADAHSVASVTYTLRVTRGNRP